MLDINLSLERHTHRTWILDLITYGILAPWWGEIKGRIDVDVVQPDHQSETFSKTTTKNFCAVWLGPYRRAYVENAYAQTYSDLFNATADFANQEYIRRNTAPNADSPASFDNAPPKEPLTNKDDSFHLIYERQEKTSNITQLVLHALGGVQASVFYGKAKVSSTVKDENGNNVEVAAGKASQKGWGISIFGPPSTTGFYVAPALGFISQEIELADFRRTLPEAKVERGIEIAAVCSNPATGATLDCSAPNVYRLLLKSGYGGLRFGYDLVTGNSTTVFVASANIGINILEYRSVNAKIARYNATHQGFDLLNSGAAGLSLGFEFPRLHTALTLAGDYEFYRSFTFDRPLQFEGEVIYNEIKAKYERPLREVSAASLTAMTMRLSLAITF
ncbi:MAG: hypothetical protein JW841_17695 [Deltaproteobacteria bacterium]|nr:hypothetical protein [Deltaproteobacteria bacterium]